MAKLRKILLTTSHNPTPRTRTLCKDLARVIPSILYVNRGKMSMNRVAEKALEYNLDYVAIVDRWQGNPDKIKFFRIDKSGLVPVPPILYIADIRLQREFATKKPRTTYSVAIIKQFDASMAIVDALSKILHIPVLSEKEAIGNYLVAMQISCDATHRIQMTFMLLTQKVEIGPRVSLRRISWEIAKLEPRLAST